VTTIAVILALLCSCEFVLLVIVAMILIANRDEIALLKAELLQAEEIVRVRACEDEPITEEESVNEIDRVLDDSDGDADELCNGIPTNDI